MNSNIKIRLLVLLALIGVFVIGIFLASRNVAIDEENPFLINSSENLPLTIQLVSSMCLGDCPVYRILIMDDGVAYFDGEANTLADGVHKVDLSADIMNQLKERILEANFFDLNIQSSVILDVSYNYLGIAWNEKSKSMRYIRGQDLPRELYELQCFIHTIIESSKWIGERDWSCERLNEEGVNNP